MAATPAVDGNKNYNSQSVGGSISLYKVVVTLNRTTNVITGTGSTTITPTSELVQTFTVLVPADNATDAYQYGVDEVYRQQLQTADTEVSATVQPIPATPFSATWTA
jgi:hypothetical protein